MPQIGNRKIIGKTFHHLIGRKNFPFQLGLVLIMCYSEFRGKKFLAHEIPIEKKVFTSFHDWKKLNFLIGFSHSVSLHAAKLQITHETSAFTEMLTPFFCEGSE